MAEQALTHYVYPGKTFFLTACLYDTYSMEVLSRTYGYKRLRATRGEQYFPFELNPKTQPGAVALFALLHPEDLRLVQEREARLHVPLANWSRIERSGIYVAVNPDETLRRIRYNPVESSHLGNTQ